MPTSSRQNRLYRELRLALARTHARDLNAWSQASAARLPKIAGRRVKNLGGLVGSVAKATGREVVAGFRALVAGRLGNHLETRAADAIDGTISLAGQITQTTATVGKALFADPRKNAPDVFALAIGFYAGSGGVDGNGGIPDADLALGIGWHRSVFTHSIIAGTVVEGAILALADLAQVVCDKLPARTRDPFWDQLIQSKDRISLQLAAGASAGIAYHLAVDSTVQPAPYHDLLVPMPIEAHQVLMGANALAEGLDAMNKRKTTGEKVVSEVKTAGGVVLKGAAAGGKYLWAFGKGFFSAPNGRTK